MIACVYYGRHIVIATVYVTFLSTSVVMALPFFFSPLSFLAYFPYFEKRSRVRSPCYVYVCVSPLMPEGRNSGARTAVARQRLGKPSRGNECTRNNSATVGRCVFYAVRVVSNTQDVKGN
jgi:hypothetical protein